MSNQSSTSNDKPQTIQDIILSTPSESTEPCYCQKSVFIRPPWSFIEPREDDIVTIPAHLKQPTLEHLRNYHAIFTETIYNDLHGFIRNQDIHGDAYTGFCKGFACQNKASIAKTHEEKQQEYEAAITYYTNAIDLKPDFANAYTNRGNTYHNKGEFDLAIKDHTTAIELDLDYADAYYNRGNVYYSTDEVDLAISDYNKAIQLKPNYSKAHNNLGIAHRINGEVDHAIENFTKAVQLKPNNVSAYYNLGVAYSEKRCFHLAIENFTTAIQHKPNYAKAYNGRGEARLHLQEWEKAKADLTTARDMGMDIIAKFQSAFGTVANFELINDIQLPEDIAALLTPPQS